MSDLQPCNGKIVTTTGDMYGINKYERLFLNMRTIRTIHPAKRSHVAYVPKISYHLLSMHAADAGHR